MAFYHMVLKFCIALNMQKEKKKISTKRERFGIKSLYNYENKYRKYTKYSFYIYPSVCTTVATDNEQ